MERRQAERGEWDIDEAQMRPVRGPEEIPRFANEDEEDAFWSTHYIGAEWFDRVGEIPPDQRLAVRLRRLADPHKTRQP